MRRLRVRRVQAYRFGPVTTVALTIPVMESWTWPWAIGMLQLAYLSSGLIIAAHYIPLLQRAWRFPAAAATAHSLLTWSVWTVCRAVAFTYGVFVVHDLVFLIVVGADLFGRFAVAALIVRARAIASDLSPLDARAPQPRMYNDGIAWERWPIESTPVRPTLFRMCAELSTREARNHVIGA